MMHYVVRRTPKKAMNLLLHWLQPSQAPLLVERNVCPVALPWLPDLSLLRVEPRIGGWGVRDYRPAFRGTWVRDDQQRELFETQAEAEKLLTQIRATAEAWMTSHYGRVARI